VFPAAAADFIFLGSFRFTADMVGGQVAHLLATDLFPGRDETVTGAGRPLDGLIGDGQVTITIASS